MAANREIDETCLMRTMRAAKVRLDLSSLTPLGEIALYFLSKGGHISVRQLLSVTEDEMTEILRIQESGNFHKISEISRRRRALLKKYRLLDFHILEADARHGSYMVFATHQTPPSIIPLAKEIGRSLFIIPPFNLKSTGVEITVLVKGKRSAFIQKMMRDNGLKFELMSIGAISFENGTALSGAQLQAIDAACKYGYFEIPRRSSSREIAQKLAISPAAFTKNLRRAERILFEEFMVKL
ncbi:MAG: helix-turn-helix domain-containing protein [Methanomassiliicoccales archaeon]